jgi:hypothetical protein
MKFWTSSNENRQTPFTFRHLRPIFLQLSIVRTLTEQAVAAAFLSSHSGGVIVISVSAIDGLGRKRAGIAFLPCLVILLALARLMIDVTHQACEIDQAHIATIACALQNARAHRRVVAVVRLRTREEIHRASGEPSERAVGAWLWQADKLWLKALYFHMTKQ